ncbi:MAG: DUF3352 domain-containing protein [Kaiparowitsia implicata GSE-PSE-MK54-09C]|jgi:hypothetical protein|nr:DUF3352 domain-containing protein [Kaiparowitsia implicata GSE-PSE-MK54-09C]
MKLRSFFVTLGLVVLVLLGISAGGWVWLAAQSPLMLLSQTRATSPAAAMFVPKQAPAMVSLLVNPDELEAVRVAIAPANQRRQARTEVAQLKSSLLSGRNLDYDTDIKPWLGSEVTLAVTTPDVDRDQANGSQPGYLLALETRDGDRAREFLQVLWQRRAIAGVNLVFEQYAGVKIISGQPSRVVGLPTGDLPGDAGDGTLATAVVGDRFVLVANAPKVLRDAINNVQAASLNLSSNPTYRQSLTQLAETPIGMAYVNLPSLGQWLDLPERQLSSAIDDDAGDTAPLIDRMVAGIELNPQGILANTVLLAAEGHPFPMAPPALSHPVEALKTIPLGSAVVAGGTHLNTLLPQLNATLQTYGVLSALVTPALQRAKQELGIPLTQDWVDWVEGEFALAWLPEDDNGQQWVFAGETSEATATALAQMDAIAQRNGLGTGPVTLADQTAYAWTKLTTPDTTRRRRNRQSLDVLQVDVRGVHTQVDRYEVFATSLDAMEAALNARAAPLLKDAEFQRAIAPLNPRNNGYLYIDWPAVRPTLEAQLPILRLAELAAKPLFDHVRSLTMSSYGSDPTAQRGAVFVRLSEE